MGGVRFRQLLHIGNQTELSFLTRAPDKRGTKTVSGPYLLQYYVQLFTAHKIKYLIFRSQWQRKSPTFQGFVDITVSV